MKKTKTRHIMNQIIFFKLSVPLCTLDSKVVVEVGSSSSQFSDSIAYYSYSRYIH